MKKNSLKQLFKIFVIAILLSKVSMAEAHTNSISEEIQSIDAMPPMELMFFKARVATCSAILKWQTASLGDCAYFDIERSPNRFDFKPIGRVKASQAGTTHTYYQFLDEAPSTVNHYRLKCYDQTGASTYSRVITVNIECLETNFISSLYPNPTGTDVVHIDYQSDIAERNSSVVVMNMMGEVVKRIKTNIVKGKNTLNLDLSTMASGQYLVQIIGDNKVSNTMKFVKK